MGGAHLLLGVVFCDVMSWKFRARIEWIDVSVSLGPSSDPSPANPRPWFAIAINAAHCGHPALVPPIVCHPTPWVLSKTENPVSGSASYDTSGAYVP